jgi:hypothetical protein
MRIFNPGVLPEQNPILTGCIAHEAPAHSLNPLVVSFVRSLYPQPIAKHNRFESIRALFLNCAVGLRISDKKVDRLLMLDPLH